MRSNAGINRNCFSRKPNRKSTQKSLCCIEIQHRFVHNLSEFSACNLAAKARSDASIPESATS
jgi:hypothetical protein